MAQNDNNKRIAKNTMLLYFRMILTMLVSLYTVRIVLNTLGTVDFGIYSVVGGIVTLFAFLSSSMASASLRFFAYELGRNDIEQLKKTFSMTMTIYIMIAVIILVFAETIGLWILNTQMTIPTERMAAAQMVYQFSIFSFMMTMFTIPYNASIIAHENMKVYAYVSIIEVLLKLVIVYLLVLFSYDKLKLYAFLMFGVTGIVTLIYRTYCKRKFVECTYTYFWDKKLFKEIFSYSGWNLFSVIALALNTQGVNIILNSFFGPLVNASRGIAYQVNSAVDQFVQNFMTATRPQIIKYYSTGENEKMLKLIFQSSKLSFFLLFILSMPILLETNYVFILWLKLVPDYAVIFTRLVIISLLINSLSYPLITGAQATGDIKKYQLTIGLVAFLNLPISYLFLKIGFPAQSVFFVTVVFSIIYLVLRLVLLKELIGLSRIAYLKEVILPVSITATTAYIIPLIISNYLPESFLRFAIVVIIGFIISIFSIFFIGMSLIERNMLKEQMKKLSSKFLNK
jgi:O-antigen/teichoic acid export membrane protein